jgi:acyl-CoA synthetase (NDP forming)
MDPAAVCVVLGAYGVEMPACRLVGSADVAVAAAEELGWPVALKIVSPTIAHRSDVRGVVLDLGSPWDLRAAHRALVDRLAAAGRLSEVTGLIVEKMAPRQFGVETRISLTRVPDCGALMAFGVGGVQAEIAPDVVFRVNPIVDLDAREMMTQLRGAALLTGFRGSPGVDRVALEQALLRVSRLAADFPQIVSIDINPLLALAPGQGVLALDARIELEA